MKQISIGLIPNFALGDGLVALIIANNLWNNNYRVTVIHNVLAVLNDWFDFDIVSFPYEDAAQALQQYDLVLTDHATPLLNEVYPREEHKGLSRQYIFFAFDHLNEEFVFDHSKRLQERLGEDVAERLKHFAGCPRRIKYNEHFSMVENVAEFCRATLRLKDVRRAAGFVAPAGYKYQKYPERIVIAPTSSNLKKNWPLGKYIALAERLSADGYQPAFSFAPDEREAYAHMVPDDYAVPEIRSLNDFAVLLYESRMFVGNDSGGGHLASALGTPVATIVNSVKKKRMKWRPGWGENAVIAPRWSFQLGGKRYWHQFLTVREVHGAVQSLLARTSNSSA